MQGIEINDLLTLALFKPGTVRVFYWFFRVGFAQIWHSQIRRRFADPLSATDRPCNSGRSAVSPDFANRAAMREPSLTAGRFAFLRALRRMGLAYLTPLSAAA